LNSNTRRSKRRYEEATNEIFEETPYEYDKISPILLGIKSSL